MNLFGHFFLSGTRHAHRAFIKSAYEKSSSIGVVYTCSLLREDGDCFVRRRVVRTPTDFTGAAKLVSVIESVDTVDEVEDAVEDSVLFRF